MVPIWEQKDFGRTLDREFGRCHRNPSDFSAPISSSPNCVSTSGYSPANSPFLGPIYPNRNAATLRIWISSDPSVIRYRR